MFVRIQFLKSFLFVRDVLTPVGVCVNYIAATTQPLPLLETVVPYMCVVNLAKFPFSICPSKLLCFTKVKSVENYLTLLQLLDVSEMDGKDNLFILSSLLHARYTEKWRGSISNLLL